MAFDDRLCDLLVDWDHGRRAGVEPSLEELCRDTPDLLPLVRESVDSLKATEWMFRSSESEASGPDTIAAKQALCDTELPASHLTAEEFAASIFQSGLLSRGEIDELQQRLAASDLPGEAREIATRLVSEGKLTRYQASVLLKASKDPLLVDNYVILDTLDTGGMGLVFKALHRSMNRVVALKLLPASMMGARDTVKRFQREVKAAAALKHPNIVAAYDAAESAEIAYLVLEFVEGSNLFRLVKEQGPLPVAHAADYVRQAAAGLSYLHSRGIIHRDVKPANLILARDGQVKLLDMGLVRFASSEDLSSLETDQELTQAGIVIGTVAYMSPEQALDTRSADRRSDIYSLGCTLFYLLTGRSLYHGETGMKTLLAHREQPVPTIRQFRADVPDSVDAVFRTMVAKRPADRLQTMEEVIDALDACIPGLPAATSVGPSKPASAAPRATVFRSRGVRLGLLAGFLGAAALLGTLIIRIRTKNGTIEIPIHDSTTTVEIDQADSPAPEKPKQSANTDPQRHNSTSRVDNLSREHDDVLKSDVAPEPASQKANASSSLKAGLTEVALGKLELFVRGKKGNQWSAQFRLIVAVPSFEEPQFLDLVKTYANSQFEESVLNAFRATYVSDLYDPQLLELKKHIKSALNGMIPGDFVKEVILPESLASPRKTGVQSRTASSSSGSERKPRVESRVALSPSGSEPLTRIDVFDPGSARSSSKEQFAGVPTVAAVHSPADESKNAVEIRVGSFDQSTEADHTVWSVHLPNLIATVAPDHFQALLHELGNTHAMRVREAVLEVLANTRIGDLRNPKNGILKRNLKTTINSALSQPYVQEILIGQLELIKESRSNAEEQSSSLPEISAAEMIYRQMRMPDERRRRLAGPPELLIRNANVPFQRQIELPLGRGINASIGEDNLRWNVYVSDVTAQVRLTDGSHYHRDLEQDVSGRAKHAVESVLNTSTLAELRDPQHVALERKLIGALNTLLPQPDITKITIGFMRIEREDDREVPQPSRPKP